MDLKSDEEISQIDRSNFRQFIRDFPNQFETGLNLAKDVKVDGEFSKVLVSGMGGSALPVNLLQTYMYDYFTKRRDKEPFAVEINRYYPLPPLAYHKCLNLISSYSGTTEETINAFNESINANLPTIGISSGGDIERLCHEHNVPHIKLPIPFENFQPREGTGYFLSVFYQLMVNHGLVEDASEEMLSGAQKLRENMDKFDKKGLELSQMLRGKTPVIYASSKFASVAMIWKIKLNENAKTPTFWNYFPELNHNEMQGYAHPQGKFIAVMLKDPDDFPRNLKRYEATASIIGEKGIESTIVEMENGNVFYKMFSSVLVSDFTSYYLAIAYDQDPTPVDMVEDFKKILVRED